MAGRPENNYIYSKNMNAFELSEIIKNFPFQVFVRNDEGDISVVRDIIKVEICSLIHEKGNDELIIVLNQGHDSNVSGTFQELPFVKKAGL